MGNNCTRGEARTADNAAPPRSSNSRIGQRAPVSHSSEYSKLLGKMSELSPREKASLGAILGAFVGDSLGSYLEFVTGNIGESRVDAAMQMPGGGCWNLRPGQITDDSELAMCQLRGLIAGAGKFDLFHNCLYYGKWIQMGPFDIGQTTLAGLGPQAQLLDNPDPSVSQVAAQSSPGKQSMSNGSMMRITPLAVWSQSLTVDEVASVVQDDVSLMHSKVQMWSLCTAYCLAIRSLIKNAGQSNRAATAIATVHEYQQKVGVKADSVGQFLRLAQDLAVEMLADPSRDYFDNDFYDAQTQMGFVKHGFVLAMYCLIRAQDKPLDKIYDFSMRQTVMLGGDSDTNCAIVGGVIGAFAAVDNIDTEKLRKVLEVRVNRPQFIQPALGCIDEMLALIAMAPSQLEKVTVYKNKKLDIQ